MRPETLARIAAAFTELAMLPAWSQRTAAAFQATANAFDQAAKEAGAVRPSATILEKVDGEETRVFAPEEIVPIDLLQNARPTITPALTPDHSPVIQVIQICTAIGQPGWLVRSRKRERPCGSQDEVIEAVKSMWRD